MIFQRYKLKANHNPDPVGIHSVTTVDDISKIQTESKSQLQVGIDKKTVTVDDISKIQTESKSQPTSAAPATCYDC